MSSDFGDVGNLVADVGTLGLTAGMRGAKAAGDAANSQFAQQKDDRGVVRKYAEPTPDELKQINQSITLNQQDIDRKQKLLDSSDPALIEAGAQALQLLRGQDAKTLAPLRAQFDQQESALRAKLSSQLGAGYENSTAGIQALQAFNLQKENALAGAQQNALGQLLGVAQNTSANYGMQSNINNSQNLANLFGNIQKRQISAVQGTPVDASLPFVGAATSANANSKFIDRGIQVGGMLASGGLSGLFGGGGGSPVSTGSSPLGGVQVNTSNYGKYM